MFIPEKTHKYLFGVIHSVTTVKTHPNEYLNICAFYYIAIIPI